MSGDDWGGVEDALEPGGQFLGPHMERLEPDLNPSTRRYRGRLDSAERFLDGLDPESVSIKQVNKARKKLKKEIVDYIAFGDIFSHRLEFLDDFKEKYGMEADKEVIQAFRHGQDGSLLKEEMDLFKERSEKSILEDENDVADAIITDYYFRGGKGLRSTLSFLTEYSLAGNLSYETGLIGALIDILHTSTLHQDDEMDDDDMRRGGRTGKRLNEDFHGEYGKYLSILDGNEMEAWTNQMNTLLSGLSVPSSAMFAFPRSQELVNEGQRTDIVMEGRNMGDMEVEDYKDMSMHKTGYLFLAAAKMVIDNVYQDMGPCDVYRGFDKYIENLNYAFQGQDDFLEAFKETTDKSDSDISNRKKTFPAINTYSELMEFSLENDNRADELFLYFFNKEYLGESEQKVYDAPVVGSPVRWMRGRFEDFRSDSYNEWMVDTSEEMEIELPDNRYESDEWIREVMTEFGEEYTGKQLRNYADTGAKAIEYLEERDAFRNDTGPELLKSLIQFMPERAV